MCGAPPPPPLLIVCVYICRQSTCFRYTLYVDIFLYKVFESLYIEYTKLCIFFECLDIECTDVTLSVICEEKCPRIKKLCMLNIQNYVLSLKNSIYWLYIIVHIFWKIVYIKYTILWMFFEKLCVYSINKIKIFESLDNKYTKLRIFFASLDI